MLTPLTDALFLTRVRGVLNAEPEQFLDHLAGQLLGLLDDPQLEVTVATDQQNLDDRAAEGDAGFPPGVPIGGGLKQAYLKACPELQAWMALSAAEKGLQVTSRPGGLQSAAQMHERYAEHLAVVADYWSKLDQSLSERRDGLAFSFLVLQDGGSGLMPGLNVTEQSTGATLGWDLHERWDRA